MLKVRRQEIRVLAGMTGSDLRRASVRARIFLVRLRPDSTPRSAGFVSGPFRRHKGTDESEPAPCMRAAGALASGARIYDGFPTHRVQPEGCAPFGRRRPTSSAPTTTEMRISEVLII